MAKAKRSGTHIVVKRGPRKVKIGAVSLDEQALRERCFDRMVGLHGGQSTDFTTLVSRAEQLVKYVTLPFVTIGGEFEYKEYSVPDPAQKVDLGPVSMDKMPPVPEVAKNHKGKFEELAL